MDKHNGIYTEPEAVSPQDIEKRLRQYIYRLRLQFLTPSVLVLIFTVIILVTVVYLHESESIDNELIELHSTAKKLFENSIKQNAKSLQTIMDGLITDRELISALVSQDRTRLLQLSAPIYENFNRHYGITHFYFSSPERINILRVHKPEKYGDTINRQTTLMGEQDGEDHYGIELGPMGTLTLRYVKPWYEGNTHRLIGYVELGMEVDTTIDSLRSLLELDVFVLVNKRYLERNGWEEGLQTFDHKANWDRFRQVVLAINSNHTIPTALSTLINALDFNTPVPHITHQHMASSQRAIFIPFKDVFGRPIGCMAIIKDTSHSSRHVQETVLIGTGLLLFGSLIAVIFIYWFVGRVAERMGRNEISLQQLATHDGLTGLLNRRQLDLALDSSILQYTRYGRIFSLLMIDIDHFKQINDQYGHPEGDAVLVEIGMRLTQHARAIDSVYRYGGEEFSVLLPEADSSSATLFAQRLCEIIAEEQISLACGTKITITVSIGIASFPIHADSEKSLIQAADSSLYKAKEAGRNCIYICDDFIKSD